ncbi:hypothetical protein LINGRAHAP2_LOCUS8030 [Linum grandiflorum]
MLGIYMQRSCLLSIATTMLLTPIYALSSPILHLPPPTGQKHLRSCREVFNLSAPSALSLCSQFPTTKVPAGTESSLGFGRDFQSRPGNPHSSQLDLRVKARVWDHRRSCGRRCLLALVGCMPTSLCGFVAQFRVLDRILIPGILFLFRFRQAFPFFSSPFMLGDMVSHNCDFDGGMVKGS